ncbi:MAG: nucleotidyltransferase family protein [Veillonellales bacterium]
MHCRKRLRVGIRACCGAFAMVKRIGAVILAAGLARRMGGQKLLLQLGEMTIFSHVVKNTAGNLWQDCIAVLGQPEGELADICRQYHLRWIYNPQRGSGQASSIHLGISNLSCGLDGFVFILGDQPLISQELLRTLHDEFLRHDNQAIIVPRHDGQRCSPALFGAAWKEELLSLQGDVGGRSIIERHPNQLVFVDWPDGGTFLDADSWEDYELLQKYYLAKNGW